MPKPLILTRPSGLYVRFFVPEDVRPHIGTRYLVRSLGNRRGDDARLAAACCAVALSKVFQGLRQGGGMTDLKKLLESAQRAADMGELNDWTATGVKVGRINFGQVATSGRQDTLDFIETLRRPSEKRRMTQSKWK